MYLFWWGSHVFPPTNGPTACWTRGQISEAEVYETVTLITVVCLQFLYKITYKMMKVMRYPLMSVTLTHSGSLPQHLKMLEVGE